MIDNTDKEIVDKIVADILDCRNRVAKYEAEKKTWCDRRDKMVKEVMKQTGIKEEEATLRVNRIISISHPEFKYGQ